MTTTSHRTRTGGLVDRGKPIAFTFDGRQYSGYAGDTLASALVANGIRLVGRSFKYHRPRGIYSAGSEEPNALVELRSGARREPNTKATTVELYHGLEAQSQNRWPSLHVDLLSINSLFPGILAAGFYYKTFMWPSAFWEKVYEPVIRRAAGLGRGSGLADPDTYEQAYAFCDVLVIGSGPAGLAAARAAGRSGARVILCEEDFLLGGRLLSEAYQIDGMPGHVWAESVTSELTSLENVRIMKRTSVFGAYDGGTYGALERVSDHLPEPPAFQPRQRYWRIVTKQVVVATGAIERSIAFGNNDRPGVMLASAVRIYCNRFGARPGERLVIFTNNDDGWRTARVAHQAGINVVAIVDTRKSVSDAVVAEASGHPVIRIGEVLMSANGGYGVTSVDVKTRYGLERIPCDAVAVSGGWNPNIALACHLGSRPTWDSDRATFVMGPPADGMQIVGAAAGRYGLEACLGDGARAGAAVAEAVGFAAKEAPVYRASNEPSEIQAFWHVEGKRGKAFLDLQNDVTTGDLHLAQREGFSSIEHLKRYTTLGMATDQGKTANITALAMLADVTGRGIPEVGTTRYRPPYTPVSIGALAGHHRGRDFRPTRLTPTHEWARENGAVFVEAAAWLRAQYYPRDGETDWLTTVSREVTIVRSNVGFCDVSTLGKIDLQGSDAATFLDRLYINGFSNLPVGKARYGVMLREDGFVMDDGTTARLGEHRYIMTTTTANALRVYQHMQFCHQVLWPELDVQFVSVSDQWAQISIAGPRSRDLLRVVVDDDHDLSNEALPFMGARVVTAMGGVRARLFRISFSGELAYEIAVPAHQGDALARHLVEAGRPFGIVAYGTEALGVMRVEKGHAAGAELDGRTTAADLGLGRMMSTKKDYIGRVMAGRPALTAAHRMVLVGLRPTDAKARLRAGAHLLPLDRPTDSQHSQGVLTSVAYSPSLGHWIGLGLIMNGRTRLGERVRAYDPLRNGDIEVEICPTCFVDPEGKRLHV